MIVIGYPREDHRAANVAYMVASDVPHIEMLPNYPGRSEAYVKELIDEADAAIFLVLNKHIRKPDAAATRDLKRIKERGIPADFILPPQLEINDALRSKNARIIRYTSESPEEIKKLIEEKILARTAQSSNNDDVVAAVVATLLVIIGLAFLTRKS